MLEYSLLPIMARSRWWITLSRSQANLQCMPGVCGGRNLEKTTLWRRIFKEIEARIGWLALVIDISYREISLIEEAASILAGVAECELLAIGGILSVLASQYLTKAHSTPLSSNEGLFLGAPKSIHSTRQYPLNLHAEYIDQH
jgi:hypothetical protein